MKKIWRHTWVYKTYDLISKYFTYKKDRNYIKETFYSQEFFFVLKKYLNLDVKKDWIGRLYGVINPNINKDGMFDISNSIIEIDGENTNSNNYVQFWIYQQLEIIKQLFSLNKLYDYIDVDLEKVGPINQDNYLLIFDIVSRKEYTTSLKLWLKTSFIYLLIIGAAISGFVFFNIII